MSRKTLLQNLLRTALFTALSAAGAFLHIGHFSLQTMFSCLAGLLLGPFWGSISQLLYILLGLLGLPIFLEGGGLSYVLQPTFGFLLGMILSAYVSGILSSKTSLGTGWISLISLLSGYVIGLPYYYFCDRWYWAVEYNREPVTFFTILVIFFVASIPLDCVKWFATTIIGKRLMPTLRTDLYE